MTTKDQNPADASAGTVVLAAHAMGTRFEFVLAGENEAALRASGEEAIEEVLSLHDRLSAFSPGSVVSLLNDRAWEHPVRVAGDVFDLLCRCKRVWAESGGAFDPTVGELMALWGFRGGEGSKPDDRAVEAARGRTGMHLVELDEARQAVMFRVRGVRLDLGAIAKGWALDACAAILRERGVECALLHGGASSVIAIGHPPGLEGWGVGTGQPAGARGARLVLSLRNEALGVSGLHGRVVQAGNMELGHVLDPRSGRPLDAGSVRMCAVRGPSAAEADAWSTALMVLGAGAGLPKGMHGWLCDADGWKSMGNGLVCSEL